MKYEKIVEFTPDQLIWDFKHNSLPYFDLKYIANNWGRNIEVDPFPCSPHNNKLLKYQVNRIENIFPVGTLLQWVIVPFEVDSRTNAWASSQEIYSNDEELKKVHKLEGHVIMSGKRPIVHPAMTRYLVAHEYGHHVDYWITKLMNEQLEDGLGSNDPEIFRKKYAEFRGIDYSTTYGGNNWKNNIGEIIADDFRIAMCSVDTDFYIHDKVSHPLVDSKVSDYWEKLKENYSFKNQLVNG